jgi:hypothetical protein
MLVDGCGSVDLSRVTQPAPPAVFQECCAVAGGLIGVRTGLHGQVAAVRAADSVVYGVTLWPCQVAGGKEKKVRAKERKEVVKLVPDFKVRPA